MAKKKTYRKSLPVSFWGWAGLAVLLAITIFVSCLGISGMNLNEHGTEKLLPWVPVSAKNWPDSLTLGRALGGADYAEYAVEGDAKEAVKVIGQRFKAFGVPDYSVKEKDGKVLVEIPKLGDEVKKIAFKLAKAEGVVEFKTPDGQTFMTQQDVADAEVGFAGETGTNYALSIETTKDGKQKLADATASAIGQSISVYRDGELINSASVGDVFDDGQIVIPLGLNVRDTMAMAALLRGGEMDAALTLETEGTTDASGVKVGLIAAAVVLIAFAVLAIIRGRVTGVAAVWAVWCSVLLMMFFFATLVMAGITAAVFAAMVVGVVLACYVMYLRTDKMAAQIESGYSPRQALKTSLRLSNKPVWMALGGALAIALLLMILSVTRPVGYTLAAGVTAAAISVFLMRLFMACFVTVFAKAAFFGKAK